MNSILKPLTDKLALVTGASRGIVAVTAGAHVILTARTVAGLNWKGWLWTAMKSVIDGRRSLAEQTTGLGDQNRASERRLCLAETVRNSKGKAFP